MNTGVFLVDIAVKVTVVLLAALLATRAMRRMSAAARHAMWSVSLAAILVMPALSALGPAWRVLPAWIFRAPDLRATAAPEVIPSQAVADRAAVNSPVVDSGNVGVMASHRATENGGALPAASVHAGERGPITRRFEWRQFVMPIYMLGVLVAFLPILVGVLALLRAERRARPIACGTWARMLEEIRRGFSIRREIVLLQSSSATAMPMTWGLRRPRVLVPALVEDWSAERRRVVLLHEAAHVKRGDWLTQLLGRVACCVYWFHPLAWYAAAQARLEAEHACDDAVMGAGTPNGCAAVKPSAYASELLTLAGAFRAPRIQCAGAIAMARGEAEQLQARIRAILDSARNRQGLSAHRLTIVVILATAALLPLTALRAAAPKGGVNDAAAPAEGFTHGVHFELGESQFLPGDHITITEIRGTSDQITPQNTYQIKGTYTLDSADDADLAVYVTSGVINDTHHDPYDQRQTVHVTKGSGNFIVVLPFLSKGFPHLSYYPTNGGSSFSAQYFGTGETVWNAENEAKFWKAAGKPPADKPSSVQVLISPPDLSHPVHFELGQSKFAAADGVTITEVRGPAETFSPDNVYQVKGTYTLASRDRARLCAFVTSTEGNPGRIDPLQTMTVDKGTGNFSLTFRLRYKGFPHVSFYPANGGDSFGGTYFRTGDSVLKNGGVEDRVGSGNANPKVLIVVSPTEISFEGKPTTWEELPKLLEKVSDRENTILAFKMATDQMTIAEFNNASYRFSQLAEQFHFRYASYTGVAEHEKGPATRPGARNDSGAAEEVALKPGEKTILFVHDGKIRMQSGTLALEAESLKVLVPPDVKGKENTVMIDTQARDLRLRDSDGTVLVASRIEISSRGQVTAK